MTAHFTGRTRELAAVQRLLEASAVGKGRVVAISGEAGMGKTAFLAQAAALAQARGRAVVWSQMMEVPAAPPFLPWVLALRASLAQHDDETLRADLGVGAAEIATLVPELADRLALPTPQVQAARTRLRIFLSSPGDVARERAVAARVIARLRDEFAAQADIEAIAWEEEPLVASASFQEQLADPSSSDILVTILWTRLGTPLSGDFLREDGSRYESGTEYEFEQAWRAYRESGTPQILVYRKTAAAAAGQPGQLAALERFLHKWFRDPEDGTFTGAFHPFAEQAEFERLLETHLRKLVRQRLRRIDAQPGHGLGGESAAAFRLHDSVTRYLLATARRRPLVALFDNLHLADRSSLALLEYFCRQVADAPLLLVGAYREEEVQRSHPLRATLARLARGAGFEALRLEGLSRPEAAELLHGQLGKPVPPPLLETVHQQSDGNPLFLREMGVMLARRAGEGPLPVAGFRAGVPESLRDVIAERLRDVPGPAMKLLGLATVLGRDFDAAALGALSGQETDAVAEHLAAAEAGDIIEHIAPGRYRFRHALFREVPYAELPPTQRARLHRLAGEYIERRFPEDLGAHVPQLAHHWFEAVDADTVHKAVEYCVRAAEGAFARRAYGEATAHYERAFRAAEVETRPDLERRFELSMRLGEAQQRSGHFDAAARTFLEAALLAHRQQWWPRLADSALAFQFSLSTLGVPHEASIVMHTAALAHLPARSTALRARLEASLATAFAYAGDRKAAEASLWRSIALGRESGDARALLFCIVSLVWVRPGPEHLARRLDLAREAVGIGQGSGLPEDEAAGFSCLVQELAEACRTDELQAVLPRYERVSQTARDPVHINVVVAVRAAIAILRGRWVDALRFASEAVSLASQQGSTGLEGRFAMQMFAIQKARGALDAVAPFLKTIVAGIDSTRLWAPGLALLQCELGQGASARATLEGLEDPRALPRDALYEASLAYLSEAYVHLGDVGQGAAVYELLLPYRSVNITVPWALMLGAGAGYLAPLAALLGKREAARSLFEEAVAVNESMGAAPMLARVQTDFAQFLIRDGDAPERARARELLAAASATARALELRPVAERSGALLAEAGEA